MDIPTTDQLIAAIEAFISETGMAPTRFGRDATGEPQLLNSMRRGRSPSLENASRIAAFIESRRAEIGEEHPTVNDASASTTSPGAMHNISQHGACTCL